MHVGNKVNLVCAAVAVSGLAAVLLSVLLGSLVLHPWSFIGLLVLVTYVQVRPHRIMHAGRHALGIQLDELLFVPAAVFLSPVEALLVFGVAFVVSQVLQRKGLAKTSFNVGQILVATGLGLLTYHVLVGVSWVPNVFAAILGGCMYAITSAMLVSLVVTVSQGGGGDFRNALAEQLSPRLLAVLGSLSLGAIITLAVSSEPWSIPLALIPAIMVQGAYATALEHWESRQRTEAMHVAAGKVRSSLQVERVRVALTSSARELLGAQVAEVVAITEPDLHGSISAPVGEGWKVVVSSRDGGGEWADYDRSALRSLAAIGGGAMENASLFQRLDAITSNQGEGVVALDDLGQLVFANPAACRLLSLHRDDFIYQPADKFLRIRLEDDTILAFDNLPQEVQGEGTLLPFEADPVPVAYTVSSYVSTDPDGATHEGRVAVLRDATERRQFEDQLAYQAYHDPLTGLPNRRLFLDKITDATRRSEQGSVEGIVLFDVDHFKRVNDSLGHSAGDALLVGIAQRVRGCLPEGTFFARLSGDEFVVLVQDITDPESLVAVANDMASSLREPFVLEGHEVFTTISVGVADTRDPVSRVDLRSAADVALYQAKAQGRGRVAVFTGSTSAQTLERLDLESKMRHALQDPGAEFVLHYQPIVETSTGRTVGAEALVRWNVPGNGMVSPGSFIPLAEETGMVRQLGAWVLEEACTRMRQWTQGNPTLPPLSISVNLSVKQLSHPSIVADVEAILARTQVDPAQVMLEITESVIMENNGPTLERLAELKALGLRIAMDDFGTGYSSLGYLKLFPIDVVKVDRAFVKGLGAEPVDEAILEAILKLVSAVGMRAVVEGVETKEQHEVARRLGCPLSQGFYHARPVPEEAFLDTWLRPSRAVQSVDPCV